MEQHDQRWIDELAGLGHAAVEPLAVGMEGAVYRLGGGLVAKVWGRRDERDLIRIKEFYDELAARGLSFATPRILRIHGSELGYCTIEEELAGTPLDRMAPSVDGDPGPRARDHVLDVLAELGSVIPSGGLRRLPVMDESVPFRDSGADWAGSLIALIHRRLSRFGPQLDAAVTDLPGKVEQVTRLLRAWGHGRDGLLHGDLITANILVDETLRPTAVLDFGFLTAPGDPAFDVAVTASIIDMYGPQHRRIEAAFDEAAVKRFGYPRELLLLYRAAYALITSNAYDPEGADGHFRWCAAMLERDDVVEVLDS
ncbi:phosphotransferase family protein [Streptomyces naphthomycinicus]|uniref:phosphotransferase family protein n=1 Tax=Streptomyces naphthomycinicus TaxID=2872625 RepID=UPI001CED8AD2|nr:phosphotransferase [Streptomyces sp. TML10]